MNTTDSLSNALLDSGECCDADQQFKALRDECFRNARLSTIGDMAGGLTHELNQPLVAAANYIAAAQMTDIIDASQAGKVIEHVRRAGECIDRAADIIHRLRGFIGAQVSTAQPVELKSIIDGALVIALPTLDRLDLEVQVSVVPQSATASVDRILVQQVLVNLIRNAVEAARAVTRTGKIEITAQLTEDEVIFCLTDDGPGFPDTMITDQQPFFSTKGCDNLGLGIMISRRIVEAQGGKLTIRNRPDFGAVVSFTLPILEQLS